MDCKQLKAADFRLMSQKNHKVAIVIPTHKAVPSAFEVISIQQCYKVFPNTPIIFCFPEELETTKYEQIAKNKNSTFNCIYFPKKDFSSFLHNNHLLVTKRFYSKFKNFDYMLLYHTDSFVFRDELAYWCNKGYDYIGAPFFDGFKDGDGSEKFWGAGNGGFSLRKISSFLKVCNSFSYIRTPKELIAINKKKRLFERLLFPLKLVKHLSISNNTFHWFNDFYDHEDMYWGVFVKRNFPWFKVASIEEAIPFSFEMQAEKLLEKNKNQLPFGCHAWWLYELDFWKPYIETYGYSINQSQAVLNK